MRDRRLAGRNRAVGTEHTTIAGAARPTHHALPDVQMET
jgi:hypothetical protein